MEKEKIAKIVKKVQDKLAEIKDYRFGPGNWKPQNAIWSQTQDELKAFISRYYNNVKERDEYKIEIFNKSTGKRVKEDYKLTLSLPEAKKEVFKYFNQKST